MGLSFLSKQVHRHVRIHAKAGTLARFVNGRQSHTEEDFCWPGRKGIATWTHIQYVAVDYTMKQTPSSLTFKSSSRDKVELGSLSSQGLIYSCNLLKDSQMRTTERP